VRFFLTNPAETHRQRPKCVVGSQFCVFRQICLVPCLIAKRQAYEELMAKTYIGTWVELPKLIATLEANRRIVLALQRLGNQERLGAKT
jgi:hypothetical protein